jgi:hypothetical protein
MVTPGWHRHGTAQGGSKGAALRGIGRRQLGERNGEVTDRKVVSAALPMLGVHGGCYQGSDAGEAGSAREAVRWGCGLHGGWRHSLVGGRSTREERRGFSREGVCLGLPLPLDSKLKMTRERDFSQILWLQRGRSNVAPFPSPCRLEVKKEREKGMV